MQGDTKLVLNKATMNRALEVYLTTVMKFPVRVVNVVSHNQLSFEVSFTVPDPKPEEVAE